MITANFKGTQQDLYAICKLAWNSCTQHLADFTAFKTKYDATFVADQLTEVDAAEAMPDSQARYAESEVLRVHLVEMATDATNNWQNLKRYIADAFPEIEQKARLEEAGSNYYLKAGNDSWDNVQGLLTAGKNFITTHDAILQSAGFMPTTFSTKFSDDKAAFNTKHQLFLDSEETAKQETQVKNVANNDIFANLMVMLLDGQEIFKYDEATKAQFIYSELLSTVSGVGQAGIRGTITNAQNNEVIANAIIEIPTLDKDTTSNEAGLYILKPVASGTYNIRITAIGYEPQTIENFKIKVGTVSTQDIGLTPTP